VDHAAALDISPDVLEACQQFHKLIGIPVTFRAIQSMHQLKSLKQIKFLLIGISDAPSPTQVLAAATEFRNHSAEYSALPVLCLGERPLDTFESATNDFEFVSYITAPFQPLKYLEIVRPIILRHQVTKPLLEKRYLFLQALGNRDFKRAANLHGELSPLYENNPLQHRLLKVQYFNKLCDTKSLYLELKETLHDYPDSLKTREMWTVLLDQLGRTKELKAAVAEGLKLYPEHPPFLTLEGDLHLSSGNITKAESYYLKAFKLQPTLNEAKWGLLISHFTQPKKNFGKDLLGDIDTKSKKFLKYCDRRFKALANANKWATAAALMHGMLRERRDNNTEYLRWMNYAVALLRSGEQERSVEALRKCMAMSPREYKNARELMEKIIAGGDSKELSKVVDL
jgi:tetratricopeptide (TPR) repeat protein